MRGLPGRAIDHYRSNGPLSTIRQSLRFAVGYARHGLGKRGLYRRRTYRWLLIQANTGFRRYSALADPFKILYIKSDAITRVTGRGPFPGRLQWQDIGRVEGGEWDLSEQSFEDLPVVNLLHERFAEGKEWSDINGVERVILGGGIDGFGSDQGYGSDVLRKCKQIDELYENIRDHGYLQRAELIEMGEETPDKFTSGDGFNRYNEIAVDIGRDGQFLFVDGRHRLAFAKILGLDEIPVRIVARHKRWQLVREAVAATDDPESLPREIRNHLGHPDLDDVRDGRECEDD